MPRFEADHLRIAYDDIGEGDPIVLLHGFAADSRLNWKLPGWYGLLQAAGFRVLAPDARGHGRSDKSSDVEDYRPEGIAGDAVRLLDHLGIERADLFGYSMGGRNAGWLIANHGDRFGRVVIGGAGINLLQIDDPEAWEARGFRLTADNRKRDSLAIPAMTPLYEKAAKIGGKAGALSACLLGAFPSLPADDFAGVRNETLVICGEKDTTSGSPIPLAEAIPGARAVVVPGKSHLSVIGDAFFKGAVMGFLGQRWPRA